MLCVQDYLLALVTPLYDLVGFDDNVNDPHLDQYKRVLAVSSTCHLNYPDCVINAVSLYQQWMQNPANQRLLSCSISKHLFTYTSEIILFFIYLSICTHTHTHIYMYYVFMYLWHINACLDVHKINNNLNNSNHT